MIQNQTNVTNLAPTITDKILNTLYIIFQITASCYMIITILRIQKNDKKAYFTLLVQTILLIIFMLKFVTIGSKLLLHFIMVVIPIILNFLIYIDKQTNSEKNIEIARSIIDGRKWTLSFINVILSIIILYVIYLYYFKQDKKFISHVHKYFIISNCILVGINFIICLVVCCKSKWKYQSQKFKKQLAPEIIEPKRQSKLKITRSKI